MSNDEKTCPAKRILVVDDDVTYTRCLAGLLEELGFNVAIAHTAMQALELVQTDEPFAVAVLDMYLPATDGEFCVETEGFNLASKIRRISPQTRLIACSGYFPRSVYKDLPTRFDEAVAKRSLGFVEVLVAAVERLSDPAAGSRKPNILIVHGHDEEAKFSLKNYLQNTLKLGEPVILHEQPSHGRTLVTKFEDLAEFVDIAFVILTPDDVGGKWEQLEDMKKRARPNVIFELGFFVAALQRESGRVVLLRKGEVELPSDIAGVGYIDISNGIEAAGEEIRRELAEWLG